MYLVEMVQVDRGGYFAIVPRRMQRLLREDSGRSCWGWVLLLGGITAVAAILRLFQLDQLPPGLYRDEAFNGLDALGVLAGNHPLFFAANNGREPIHIYFTALLVQLLGPTVTAVRLGAALVGTVTTIPVFLLANSWYGRRVALFAAWLWAVTLWPVHLSRIGLRIIWLVPLLTLTFWLGTLAYRHEARRRWALWLAAGLVYGLCFYTYLAVRVTPLLLLLLLLFVWWRGDHRRLWPGVVWFAVGTAVAITPLALFYLQNSALLLGRTGQVSILNPAIHGGDLPGMLLRQAGRALGLFIWQGDTIVRHNPPGRPLFDWLMALPFLIGLVGCVRQWRRLPVAATLLWIGVMLSVTILAEDAPHFLRVVGILPVALFLPAWGLDWLWRWATLPLWARRALVLLLLAGSLWLTVRDYVAYGRAAETALLFEQAAVQLAADIEAETGDTAVYLDRWFWDDASQKGWPAIPFLADLTHVTFYRPELGVPPPAAEQPIAVYAWKFGDLRFLPGLLANASQISIHEGVLARGDLEAAAYPLYVRYHAQPLAEPAAPAVAQFAEMLTLTDAVAQVQDAGVQVTLNWAAAQAIPPEWTAFVQVVGPEGVIGQRDLPPGGGNWAADWWQPGQQVQEVRQIPLTRPYDPTTMQILVGVYNSQTQQRLPATDAQGAILGDFITLPD